MGLITKKDVIRNMASLEEEEEPENVFSNEQEFVPEFEGQEGGLLDTNGDIRRRSDDSG